MAPPFTSTARPRSRRAWNRGISTRELGLSRPVRLREVRRCAREGCTEQFETYPSVGKLYCSLECRSRATARRGSENPAWKGGRVGLALQIRRSRRGREWREAVFDRDHFTCRECGQVGGSLHAHHVEAFARLLSLHEISTIDEALACEPLWSVANGLTLCEGCHKRTDNYLWRAA